MEDIQTFDDYLISKKIDGTKFQADDAKQYADLKLIFDQMHSKSFTQQKLFLINPLRIKYSLTEENIVASPAKAKAAFKPKISK